MKGFIEISMEGQKSIIAVDQIARCYRFGDVWVNRKKHPDSAVISKKKEISDPDIVLDERYAEIVSKIEAATSDLTDDVLLAEVCSLREKLKIATEIIKSFEPDFDVHQLGAADYDQCCDDLSTPEIIRQNIYYRTDNRKPTKEEAGPEGHVLISDNTVTWRPCHIVCVDGYRFWAPVPKVEVR